MGHKVEKTRPKAALYIAYLAEVHLDCARLALEKAVKGCKKSERQALEDALDDVRYARDMLRRVGIPESKGIEV